VSEATSQGQLAFAVSAGQAETGAGAEEAMAIPLSGKSEPNIAAKDNGVEPAGTLIEPGRALALSDFTAPAMSAGERLMVLAYRLGVPGSTMAAPFRKPARPRLLATVDCPLRGDRVAGVALRAGHFLVHGVKAPIGQMDFSPSAKLTQPFERTVHGFTWLADLAASAPREQCVASAERVLSAWLAANPRPGKGPAWKVGHAGHRLLGWLVHAPMILSGQDKALRGTVLHAVSETARWLDRNVARAEDRLAEVAGWCGITAAGLLLPDGKARRLFGEAGLIRALGELGVTMAACCRAARLTRWKRSRCCCRSKPAIARPGATHRRRWTR